jgi:hypothetical protein
MRELLGMNPTVASGVVAADPHVHRSAG